MVTNRAGVKPLLGLQGTNCSKGPITRQRYRLLPLIYPGSNTRAAIFLIYKRSLWSHRPEGPTRDSAEIQKLFRDFYPRGTLSSFTISRKTYSHFVTQEGVISIMKENICTLICCYNADFQILWLITQCQCPRSSRSYHYSFLFT